jgi:hypothetical protein
VTSQKSPQLLVSNKFVLADSIGSDLTSIKLLIPFGNGQSTGDVERFVLNVLQISFGPHLQRQPITLCLRIE